MNSVRTYRRTILIYVKKKELITIIPWLNQYIYLGSYLRFSMTLTFMTISISRHEYFS